MNDSTQTDITYINADWANLYQNIEELTGSSDLVVKGTIVDSISYEYKLSEPTFTPLLLTNYTFKIEQVIKGDLDRDLITIKMTGGTLNGRTVVFRGDPLMKKGDTVILFLRKYTPDNYYILGGPQGRFVIQKGKVYSLGEVDKSAEALTSHLKTGGISVNQFINSIPSK